MGSSPPLSPPHLLLSEMWSGHAIQVDWMIGRGTTTLACFAAKKGRRGGWERFCLPEVRFAHKMDYQEAEHPFCPIFVNGGTSDGFKGIGSVNRGDRSSVLAHPQYGRAS